MLQVHELLQLSHTREMVNEAHKRFSGTDSGEEGWEERQDIVKDMIIGYA